MYLDKQILQKLIIAIVRINVLVIQAKTSIEKLTKAKVMLQKEKEELNKQLSAEKRKKESPKAALSKVR